MSGFISNSVGWFEIGTDKPEITTNFFSEVFGWTFGDSSVPEYSLITTPGANPLPGGVLSTGGQIPNYATFYILVADVPATLAKAEQLGGKTLMPPSTTSNGLVFAQLCDPAGNRIGVMTPPPES
jgi:predicted enzyme related to lactoylglutathione lyase